eukprot:CAMPEP_0196654402 /NCGR_PEP_ID=MMETSP1086-20130531/4101_1 /TAXON_ID=77921 /ORGANISM="Cyanoptyche  gloeocystis , Strain SAG4.97" /LENGTH=179 /DNA_ID=CAMNT_0041986131 /DNA_START=66 /DNA_END=605 /DNA_ORIENTATION=-
MTTTPSVAPDEAQDVRILCCSALKVLAESTKASLGDRSQERSGDPASPEVSTAPWFPKLLLVALATNVRTHVMALAGLLVRKQMADFPYSIAHNLAYSFQLMEFLILTHPSALSDPALDLLKDATSSTSSALQTTFPLLNNSLWRILCLVTSQSNTNVTGNATVPVLQILLEHIHQSSI